MTFRKLDFEDKFIVSLGIFVLCFTTVILLLPNSIEQTVVKAIAMVTLIVLILFQILFIITKPYCSDCRIRTKVVFKSMEDDEKEQEKVKYVCPQCHKEVKKTYKSIFKPEQKSFIL